MLLLVVTSCSTYDSIKSSAWILDECSDADTSIRVVIDRETTAVGEGIHINMIVKNISAKTCKRDVGSGANEVTVISGPALIWSTDHCR